MKKRITAISLTLNFIFFVVLVYLGIYYRDRIYHVLFPEKPLIVMFGDSLTANGEWEKLLSRRDVVNSGTGGFTTSHFINIIQSRVIDFSPKLCFLEGGINDLQVGIPIARTVSNISRIVDTCKVHGIIPVLQSTIYTSYDTLQNIRVDSLNRFVMEIAKEKNVHYLDLNKKLSSGGFLKADYTVDGVHLSLIAYPLWAEIIKGEISRHSL